MKPIDHITKDIVDETRKARSEFFEIISDYSTDLWNYCKYLTGSPWDGEDLYQESIIKAFGLLPQRWSEITDKKHYLFRVATNTWIDLCRKLKREVGLLDEVSEANEDFSNPLLLEEVLISLDDILTPKQLAAFLLLNIFQFSAEEVAGIVQSTPGGVYSSVQRAKRKIASFDFTQTKSGLYSQEKNVTIQSYLEAFNKGDLDGMLELFSVQAQNEAYLGFQEFSKDEMIKGSLRFGLPGHRADELILWNKPVIVVFADGEQGPEIHDIQVQEIENGKIVNHKSYFFRKEFILAAAKELGVKAQLKKPPVDWI
ncbi:RNA polymerase sigma-70 factor (ECF subfamily) [Cytobacillus firmus]|uniref:RNA polymerase sigma-70 factor (ECF subfamily) n=2 Tax=Cytobacillus TaxID=2675230 RepID=A0A366JQV3_CYTFI|nr:MULTISPECIES: RNA polymerase sigma factor [Cytobacillus]RBP89931.1 RNA polymerase sigma-70 factor (ECF subfamily) [Cytobacillus firmus]TDX40379.1 RNA polymerase sigma-70 factor (ECF subfamily) [Cytobacillus oceanisediminis]